MDVLMLLTALHAVAGGLYVADLPKNLQNLAE